jgi:hypothetical protein
MVGWALSVAIIAALVGIGIVGVLAPEPASRQYGIVLDDPRALAFVRAMAVRDLVIGGLLALLALTGARDVLAWAMCLTVLVAVVDFAVVTADRRGTFGRATALHAIGAVGLLVTAGMLFMAY